ncbi:Caspase domain-containing protein [Bradyrhizobium erythrophlei]|nr:Caspase domain-containing protein [Bradyrhizobium erythrophlei]
MSRMGPFRMMVTAALFGLLSTSLHSIGLVKAAHNFPNRATVTSAHVVDRFQAARSDHLALLIANSNYRDADAAIAEVTAGADALANVLRNHGFLVIVVRDATRARMTEAVGRLKAAARPGSVVLVYFGGFGVQSEGQNYMIPVDAKIWQERDVRRDGVNIQRALSDLSASGARTRIAIVDASRRNPYERRFRNYSHGLAPIDADANTIVITSTSPEQVVDDADASPNRFVSDLAAEISLPSRSVEEVFAERAAARERIWREQEHPVPAMEPSEKN